MAFQEPPSLVPVACPGSKFEPFIPAVRRVTLPYLITSGDLYGFFRGVGEIAAFAQLLTSLALNAVESPGFESMLLRFISLITKYSVAHRDRSFSLLPR